MRFKERNDLANRCKEWMKDQLENNITTPLDTVHMVLAYLDVNGYLNEVVRCKDCKHQRKIFHDDARRKDGGYFIYWCDLIDGYSHVCLDDDYCSKGERREDEQIH